MHGRVRAPRSVGLAVRLHNSLSGRVEEFEPQVLAVENLFNAKNARSSLVLGASPGCGTR